MVETTANYPFELPRLSPAVMSATFGGNSALLAGSLAPQSRDYSASKFNESGQFQNFGLRFSYVGRGGNNRERERKGELIHINSLTDVDRATINFESRRLPLRAHPSPRANLHGIPRENQPCLHSRNSARNASGRARSFVARVSH